MPFKFHTFLVDEDDDLCKARPGSPPAFFSLPSPASPRICGNCMPGFAAASATAASAAAYQSSGPSREPLPQQQVRTEALAKVRHQKSADKDVLKFKDKKSAEKQVFECHSENQELTMDNLDDIIKRLIDVRSSRPGNVDLSETEIRYLCATSRDIFLSEANLLELESPVKVCGDIHGQYSDLLRLFEYGGFPPNANYLFLGNYVDYGKQGLKTMCLLLAYKIKYPEKFFLLRGNHECASINRIDGFYDECKRRFNVRVWKAFTYCFNCLPVAALVDDKILCIHGGLSPALTNLDQIRNIPRPTDVRDTGLLCDLLWSDPDRGVQGWGMNDRGVSYTFGPDKVSEFLARHDLDLVCRGHQVVEDGYEFFADRQLVTIFSAPNYRGEFDNAGAMMSIDENLMCTFQILKPEEKKPRFLSLGR